MKHLYDEQPPESAHAGSASIQRPSTGGVGMVGVPAESPVGDLIGGLAQGLATALVYRSVDKKQKKSRRRRKDPGDNCTPCAAAAYLDDLRGFAKSTRQGGG